MCHSSVPSPAFRRALLMYKLRAFAEKYPVNATMYSGETERTEWNALKNGQDKKCTNTVWTGWVRIEQHCAQKLEKWLEKQSGCYNLVSGCWVLSKFMRSLSDWEKCWFSFQSGKTRFSFLQYDLYNLCQNNMKTKPEKQVVQTPVSDWGVIHPELSPTEVTLLLLWFDTTDTWVCSQLRWPAHIGCPVDED